MFTECWISKRDPFLLLNLNYVTLQTHCVAMYLQCAIFVHIVPLQCTKVVLLKMEQKTMM